MKEIKILRISPNINDELIRLKTYLYDGWVVLRADSCENVIIYILERTNGIV